MNRITYSANPTPNPIRPRTTASAARADLRARRPAFVCAGHPSLARQSGRIDGRALVAAAVLVATSAIALGALFGFGPGGAL